MKATSAELTITFEVPDGTPDHTAWSVTGSIRPKWIEVTARPNHSGGWAKASNGDSGNQGLGVHVDVHYVKVKKDGTDSAVTGSYTAWDDDIADGPEYIRRAAEVVLNIYRHTFPAWNVEGSVQA